MSKKKVVKAKLDGKVTETKCGICDGTGEVTLAIDFEVVTCLFCSGKGKFITMNVRI